MSEKKLGLIAGRGELPLILAERARAAGREIVAVDLSGEMLPELEGVAVEARRLKAGRLGEIIRFLREAGAKEAAVAGKVDKTAIFRPEELDEEALQLLSTLRAKRDVDLLKGIASLFEREGIRLIDQRRYLSDLIPERGILAGEPDEGIVEDARFGIELARRIADLGVGQTVVVKGGVPLAVEAAEGTDEAIRRGAWLGGRGVVVAKAAGADHDFRFDMPAVGPDTLRVMSEVGAAALAVEAGRSLIIRRDELVELASKLGISVLAL